MSCFCDGFGEPASATSDQSDVTVTSKAWGTARLVHLDDHVELARLDICRGGYSSRHQHQFKTNGFLIVQGRLLVLLYAGNEQTRRILTAHDSVFTVPAGVEHRFFALEDATVVYELYCAVPGARIRQADIRRRDNNGVFRGEVDSFAG